MVLIDSRVVRRFFVSRPAKVGLDEALPVVGDEPKCTQIDGETPVEPPRRLPHSSKGGFPSSTVDVLKIKRRKRLQLLRMSRPQNILRYRLGVTSPVTVTQRARCVYRTRRRDRSHSTPRRLWDARVLRCMKRQCYSPPMVRLRVPPAHEAIGRSLSPRARRDEANGTGLRCRAASLWVGGERRACALVLSPLASFS